MLRIFLLTGVTAWAGRPAIGVRVGWPLTSPYVVHEFGQADCFPGTCIQSESAARKAVIGLSVRVPVSERFAVRVAPAWQRVSFEYTSFEVSSFALSTTGNRWEIPAVLEWRAAEHIRPGIGGTVSVVSAERTISKLVVPPGFGTRDGYTNLGRVNNLDHRTVEGLVADIEFPFRCGPAVIAPDFRYTRLVSKHFGHRGTMNAFSIGLAVRFRR